MRTIYRGPITLSYYDIETSCKYSTVLFSKHGFAIRIYNGKVISSMKIDNEQSQLLWEGDMNNFSFNIIKPSLGPEINGAYIEFKGELGFKVSYEKATNQARKIQLPELPTDSILPEGTPVKPYSATSYSNASNNICTKVEVEYEKLFFFPEKIIILKKIPV